MHMCPVGWQSTEKAEFSFFLVLEVKILARVELLEIFLFHFSYFIIFLFTYFIHSLIPTAKKES